MNLPNLVFLGNALPVPCMPLLPSYFYHRTVLYRHCYMFQAKREANSTVRWIWNFFTPVFFYFTAAFLLTPCDECWSRQKNNQTNK